MMLPLVFNPDSYFALFAFAKGWILLDIGWFVFFLYVINESFKSTLIQCIFNYLQNFRSYRNNTLDDTFSKLEYSIFEVFDQIKRADFCYGTFVNLI